MSELSTEKPEFGSNQEDVQAFNAAIESVRYHNDQFSMGKLMAKAMFSGLKKARHTQELIKEGVSEEEAEQVAEFIGDEGVSFSEEQELARSIVGFEHASTLNQTGLMLSPPRTKATMLGSQGEQTVGEVRFQLTDGGQFSNFLHTVKPEAIDEGFQNSVKRAVEDIIGEATSAITDDSAAEDAQEVATQTLAYSGGIVTGLENIGLGESAIHDKLQQLQEHAKQGDVREYVEVDKMQLFTQPSEQGFGPASWQRDASPEVLARNWQEVLKVINDAKNNPNAEQLFNEAIKSAQACLDYARNDWIQLKSEEYAGAGYGEGFEEVFETVGLELDMLASPDKDSA